MRARMTVFAIFGLCCSICNGADQPTLCSWNFEDGKTDNWRWKNNATVEIRQDEARKSKVYRLTSAYAPFNFTWTTTNFPDRNFSAAQWIDFWIHGDDSKSVVQVTLGKTPPGARSVYYQNAADAVILDFTGWQRKRVWLHRFATPRGRKRSADLQGMNFLQFMIRSDGAKSVAIALDDIRVGQGGTLPGDVALWQKEYAKMESDTLARDGSNLLPNEGSELHNGRAPNFWSFSTNWGAEAAIDTKEARSGKASVRLTCPEKRQRAACGVTRTLEPGRYRLTGWYKTKGVPKIRRTGAHIGFRYYDIDRKLCGMIDIDLPPSDGKWTKFDRSIPAPWNVTTTNISLQMHKVPGSVWWDDISLAWDVEHAKELARQAERNSNMLGKAVMGMERCVDALRKLDDLKPADDAEAKAVALVKAAFQWSIDDAERAINAQMSDQARLDLEETLARIENPQPIIKPVADAIRKAKPTAAVDGNPYVEALDKYAEGLKPVEKLRERNTYIKTAPWPKGLDGFKSVKDAWSFRSMGSRCFVQTWVLTRPKCRRFADAKLLPRVFCLLDAILSNHTDGEWIMGRSVPYHYDTNIQRFTLGPTLDAYWMLREVFPVLLPPRKRAFWEKQMALCVKRQYDTYGADNIEEADGGSGDYPNMDVYYLYIMEFAARLLNEPKYHDDSVKFMRFLQKKIYPMGATAYHGTQNECAVYHDLIVCIMGRTYEITQSKLAADILKAMVQYYPLNTEPGGVPEYYTDCWWKHYWAVTHCYGPEVMAGFSGDGMNKYVADQIRSVRKIRGAHQFTPMAAAWYRTDIEPVKPPDNRVFYDLNILGPHGRYGDFSFAGTTRKALPGEHGRDTFVGAMLVDLDKLGAMDSALQLVTTEVRYKTSDNRRDARFVSAEEKSWVTVGKDCSGLSTEYVLSRPTWGRRSETLPWQGRQTWFLGKRRLIGLLSLECLDDQEMAAVRGRVRLGMKKRRKDPERLKQASDRAFTYGKTHIRIHDHTYARIFSEPTETFYQDKPERFRSTEIVLADPLSERAGGKPVLYKKGTEYGFIVEVFPYSSKPATSIRRIDDGEICGVVFTDEDGEFAVIQSHGESDKPFELALRLPGGKVMAYADPKGTGVEMPVKGGKVTLSLPAHRHLLLVHRK